MRGDRLEQRLAQRAGARERSILRTSGEQGEAFWVSDERRQLCDSASTVHDSANVNAANGIGRHGRA